MADTETGLSRTGTTFRADGRVEVDESWKRVQQKTFTRWANSHLSDRMLKIEDLQKDLQSGVLLAQLLEIISNKSFRWNKKPRFKIQMMENLTGCLNFIKREGLKIVNIGPDDVYEKNIKIILGLIWTIILRYQINKGISEGSPKWELLQWVKKQVAPYKVPEPRDFTSSWIDGKTMSALCDSLKPGTFPKSEWSGDALADTAKAFARSESEYEIPQLMEATDMVDTPDELSNMTYVSYFRDWLSKQEERLKYLLGTPNAGFTYAEGPGLEGGYTDADARFTIYARNFRDEPLTSGGHHFKVVVAGPNGNLDCNVTDNGDGTYDGSYVPGAAGPHTVTIQISPKPEIALADTPEGAEFTDIKDSPFNLEIKATVDGASSTAAGAGLEKAYVDVETGFEITARDKHGDPIPEGGAQFAVAISGPSGDLAPAPQDNGDGSYGVKWTPTEKGDHTVAVTLNGTPISGSPFNVDVHPTCVASESTAAGDGLVDDANINTKATGFTITARDKHGDPTGEPVDGFEVAITGPNGAVGADVKDNGDGTIDVTYTPDDAGNHDVAVTFRGEPIKGAPFSVAIKPCVVTNQCTAEGPGVEGGKVDKRGPFTITARNDEGHPVADGGYDFKVEVVGPDGPVADEGVTDNGDGTYNGGWTPARSGPHTVSITDQDGNHIAASPFKFTVVPNPDPAQSYAEGPGLEKAWDNEPAKFTIHLKDKNGDPVDDGEPLVTFDGPADVKPDVKNNGDGTYSVTYEADEPGDYNIDVKTSSDGEGQSIKDMPKQVRVIEGADGSGSSIGEFTFTVHAVNKRGEPKTCGGDRFEVSIRHAHAKDAEEQDIECEATDNEDGSYTARYRIQGQGRFTINVKLNDKHVKGSPFRHKL